MRLFVILLAGAISGCGQGCELHFEEEAEAQNPPHPAGWLDKQGSAPPRTGGVLMQSCGTGYCATENLSSDTDPLMFPWGAQVVVDCASTSVVCWSQTGVQDVGSISTTVGFRDDAGNNGAGSCIRVLAGTYRTTVLDKANFDTSTAVGRRNGWCQGSTPERPCRTYIDCNAAGDGGPADADGGPTSETCNSSADGAIMSTGAFLYASSQCGWVNE